MESLLTRYKNGIPVFESELSFVIGVLTARMKEFIPDINVRRNAMFQQLIAYPTHKRTLAVCCDVVSNNI